MSTARKQITEKDDIAGKTIDRATFTRGDRRLIIVFKDGSFLSVHGCHDWDDFELDIETAPTFAELAAVGLASEDEIADHARSERSAAEKREQELQVLRRAEYERLRQEFEGPK